MAGYDVKAGDLIERLPKGENMEHGYKESSHIKAELIKRNLLSRKDLMQLYRPPVRKS